MADDIPKLVVESSAFKHNEPIPKKYTCEGKDISPPLKISNTPIPLVTFAIIVDDPDAPLGDFVHWVAWNINDKETSIKEGAEVPIQGRNDFGENKYRGPCPPPGKPHRYAFKVYALDAILVIPEGSTKHQLLEAMEGHIRAQGELIGTFER